MFGADNPQVKRTCDTIANILPVNPFKGALYDSDKMLMVCMTPRSGSQYFGSVLRDNGLGLAHEHFRYVGGQMEQIAKEFNLQSYEEFVRNRIDHNITASGFFSVKNDWMQFLPLYYLGAYDHYFKAAKFVYLTREDKLNQAISRYIATESIYFHATYVDKKNAVEKVSFSYDGIEFHLKHLQEMEKAWESFFLSENIKPLRLKYENLDANPAEVIASVFSYLGKTPPSVINVETEFRPVRTQKNKEFAEQFLDERKKKRLGFLEGYTGNETKS